MRRDREVSLWPIREAPIALSYKCRNWRPRSSIPAGGDERRGAYEFRCDGMARRWTIPNAPSGHYTDLHKLKGT